MSAKAAPEAKTSQTPEAKSARLFTAAPKPLLLRKCACGSSSGGGGCEECEANKLPLQRSATSHDSVGSIPPIVSDTLASPGRPLDAPARDFMEPRFGHDFSQVRIHTGGQAAESARAVNADAYTVGQDIVFDQGKYDPHSEGGKHLLAHELAHTIQQGGVHRHAKDAQLGGAQESHLEREAEAAAHAVMNSPANESPAPAPTDSLNVSRVAGPVLSRAAKKAAPTADAPAPEPESHGWEDPPATLKAIGVKAQSRQVTGVSNKIRAFNIGTFPLPGLKGPVIDLWRAKAAAGGLQAIVDANEEKAALWQHRADTEELRKRWITKVGWEGKDAAKEWEKAGGDKLGGEFRPKVSAETCQMDHTVELQIGGNNTTENIQALNASDNQKSGSQIWQFLRQKAADIKAKVPDLIDVTLYFDKVDYAEAPKPVAACAPGTKATSCLQVEKCALATSADAKDAASGEAQAESYDLEAGGSKTTLLVPPGTAKAKKSATITIHESEIKQNEAASELIPGLILRTLTTRPNAKSDTADACIESNGCSPKSRKSRLPITIETAKGTAVPLNVLKPAGQVKLATTNPNIKFTYPYLSEGRITKLNYEEGKGLSGEGKLRPSIPFLSKMELGVAFSPTEFRITAGVDPNKLTPPIPGAKVTKAELALVLAPEFNPSGTIEFEYAPSGKKLVTASLVIEKDANGLVARGKINAFLPGVDNAEGVVEYRNRQWSGGVKVESTQIKLPYVKSGSVIVGFSEKGIDPQGTVLLAIPGGHEAEVKLLRSGAKWVFSGKGVFKVPRLDEVTVNITYDGETLNGSGKTSFTFHSLKGTIAVFYHAKSSGEGKLSGKGEVSVSKGRAKGILKVNLNHNNKFSGEGEITYQVSENLVATAGIAIDENEKVRLKGALQFPKPIQLFKGVQGDKEIFKAGITIPIPGASIGPVGLVIKIDGRLGAKYGIGPGELRNAKIEANFNPLEDKPDLDVEMGAMLYIPAYAGIYGSIRGAIAIDAKIASVSGGLTVTASVTLDGKVQAEIKIKYQKGRFTVDALAEILAALVLGLALDADVIAEAGIGPFSVRTQKVWNLASFKYDTGLKFGMKAPLRYASDEAFKPPSLDQIQWTTPQLNTSDLLEKLLRGGGKEKPA